MAELLLGHHSLAWSMTDEVLNAVISNQYENEVWEGVDVDKQFWKQMFGAPEPGWPDLDVYGKARFPIPDVGLIVVVAPPKVSSFSGQSNVLKIDLPLAIQSIMRPWEFWTGKMEFLAALPKPELSGALSTKPIDIDDFFIILETDPSQMEKLEVPKWLAGQFPRGTLWPFPDILESVTLPSFFSGQMPIPANLTKADTHFWTKWNQTIKASNKGKAITAKVIESVAKYAGKQLEKLAEKNPLQKFLSARFVGPLGGIGQKIADSVPSTLSPGGATLGAFIQNAVDELVAGASVVGAGAVVANQKPVPPNIAGWFDMRVGGTAPGVWPFPVVQTLLPGDDFGVSISLAFLNTCLTTIVDSVRQQIMNPGITGSVSGFTCFNATFTFQVTKGVIHLCGNFICQGAFGMLGTISTSVPLKLSVEQRLPLVTTQNAAALGAPSNFGQMVLRLTPGKNTSEASTSILLAGFFPWLIESDKKVAGPPQPANPLKEPGGVKLVKEDNYLAPSAVKVVSDNGAAGPFVYLGFKINTDALTANIPWPPSPAFPLDVSINTIPNKSVPLVIKPGTGGAPYSGTGIMTGLRLMCAKWTSTLSPGNLGAFITQWKIIAKFGDEAKTVVYEKPDTSTWMVVRQWSFKELLAKAGLKGSAPTVVSTSDSSKFIVSFEVLCTVTNVIPWIFDPALAKNYLTKSEADGGLGLTATELLLMRTVFFKGIKFTVSTSRTVSSPFYWITSD